MEGETMPRAHRHFLPGYVWHITHEFRIWLRIDFSTKTEYRGISLLKIIVAIRRYWLISIVLIFLIGGVTGCDNGDSDVTESTGVSVMTREQKRVTHQKRIPLMVRSGRKYRLLSLRITPLTGPRTRFPGINQLSCRHGLGAPLTRPATDFWSPAVVIQITAARKSMPSIWIPCHGRKSALRRTMTILTTQPATTKTGPPTIYLKRSTPMGASLISSRSIHSVIPGFQLATNHVRAYAAELACLFFYYPIMVI